MRLTPELVARCFRVVEDAGPGPGFTPMPEEEAAALTDRVLAQGGIDAGAAPLRVFAYGSLIWKPGFEVAETERAMLRGWHRSFCIRLNRWRGDPAAPGLMMALERGGTCVGATLRLSDPRADLLTLIRREIPHREGADMVRWGEVETPRGREQALVFWAGPKGPGIEHRLPLTIVAARLARACGQAGSGADYLYQTVAHLEALGIRDRNLWRLQALVADEIGSLAHPVSG
ncbi:MAG: gamma-glutamylcyclotransferase [Amaricoccus sp.]|uniref:gamma-glutamylcyclotransferase n=1 Tax=Amaricoccus sp. TaxID=1872485 RepID=UPI003315F5FD